MKLQFVISHKPDIRYLKRLDIVSKAYDTSVIFWNKDINDAKINYPSVTFNEIKIPANKTNPLKRIPELCVFMRKSYRSILNSNPDCLYVGNLDMLYIAVKYKKKHRNVKIIYEIADLHRLIIDKQKNVFKYVLSGILKMEEKRLIKYVDILVLTSMKFYNVYYKNLISKDKVVFIPNMPDKDSFVGFKKVKHNGFNVAFVGSIRYKRQLKMLIEASQHANVNVIFAGSDGEGTEFEMECKKYSNVLFRGEFNYKKEIQDIYSNVDCIYAVYDADMANVRIALPNKLYEAIVTGIPIIVAKNTYLSELVEQMGIGYSVEHNNIDDLIELLKKIKDDKDDYQNKVLNCKKENKRQSLDTYNNILLDKIGELYNE